MEQREDANDNKKDRKTTVLFPNEILNGLQYYISKHNTLNFRHQSKIIVTAVAEFLLLRECLDVNNLNEELIKDYMIPLEMRKVIKQMQEVPSVPDRE